MKHPLYTLDDGTEITASSIRDGKARICVEKYDNDLGTFQAAVFSIPDGRILLADHYTEEEVQAMVSRYLPLSRDILEHIREKEDESPEFSVYQTEDHVELVKGEKVLTSVMSTNRNQACNRIAHALEAAATANGLCLFQTNVGLHIRDILPAENEFYIPDIMVCRPEDVRGDGVHGVPLFVAEIIEDEMSGYMDYAIKKEIYHRMRIPEIWIVDLHCWCIFRYLSATDTSKCFRRPDTMQALTLTGQPVVQTHDFWDESIDEWDWNPLRMKENQYPDWSGKDSKSVKGDETP